MHNDTIHMIHLFYFLTTNLQLPVDYNYMYLCSLYQYIVSQEERVKFDRVANTNVRSMQRRAYSYQQIYQPYILPCINRVSDVHRRQILTSIDVRF